LYEFISDEEYESIHACSAKKAIRWFSGLHLHRHSFWRFFSENAIRVKGDRCSREFGMAMTAPRPGLLDMPLPITELA
jgi:hypothetical protein